MKYKPQVKSHLGTHVCKHTHTCWPSTLLSFVLTTRSSLLIHANTQRYIDMKSTATRVSTSAVGTHVCKHTHSSAVIRPNNTVTVPVHTHAELNINQKSTASQLENSSVQTRKYACIYRQVRKIRTGSRGIMNVSALRQCLQLASEGC